MYELSNPVANKDVRQLSPFSVNRQQRRNCATLRLMHLLDVEGKENENNGIDRHKRLKGRRGWNGDIILI